LLMTEIHVNPLAPAIELLSNQDWIHRCEENNGILGVGVSHDRMSDLVQLLVQNDLQVSAVIPRTSLEDVFLSKVGEESQI